MRPLLLAALTVPLLSGCGGGETSSTPTTRDAAASGGEAVSVVVKDFKFGDPVRISRGGSVEWVNEDTAPHNAVGDDFKTADLEGGERDSVDFDEPGTYDYVCTFHPFMKGSVVVE